MILTSSSDEFGTPQGLFDTLNLEFNFSVDVCASKDNAKVQKYYDKDDDGLTKSWAGERAFCNPPYSRGNMVPWVEKAYNENRDGSCILAALLLPARIEQAWFHKLVKPFGEWRPIAGRVRYQGGETSARFPSMIVVFRNPGLLIW